MTDDNNFKKTIDNSFKTNYEICKACKGTGTQANRLTGLVQRCPECHGSGIWKKIEFPTRNYTEL